MSEGPWIRFFPSDWLAGTRGMTAAETGIYITLIAMMYERGEPIPNDVGRLARLCGTTTAALKSTLSVLCDEGKISVVDGGFWNDRVGVETEIRRDKSTSAQKSAETRWGKNKQKQQSEDANALQTQSDRNANQIPDTRSRDANASLKREIEREFHDEFWPIYPLKVGKPQALAAYVKARKRASFDAIMAGLRRYSAERDGQDKQFTKQAQGWLNRDGWGDEPAPQHQQRQATAPPRQTVGQQARDELKRMGMTNAPDQGTRHFDPSDGGSGFAGTGIARRIAIASSR
jgi:uncharacterized protein YdaU (DUF1376 family)